VRIASFAFAFGLMAAASSPGVAAESCPGHPDAIGTSRTITVDPQATPHIGTMQYKTSLPLKDHEVILTFDDGPLPPYTSRILDSLAENCVKVDYFLVGQMAKAYPDLVRRIYNSGHVVGTHSLSHPLTFNRMGEAALAKQVDGGIEAVDEAIGDPHAVAPFFRIPGLLRSDAADTYLAAKSLTVWSADEVADDWHHGITAKQIVARAMKRIEAKDHRGVLLLHDIHPATVLALPMLLKELKANGYKIVQAVPAGDRPASVPERTKAKVAVGDAPRALPAPAPHKAATLIKHVVHHARHKPKHVRLENEDSIARARPRTADGGSYWPVLFWR
jgi:peptidoglycan/xylan/chitin deacetylase (PgdA/CDA1 family)